MRAWQWRRGRGLSGTGGSRRAHRGQPPYLAQDEVGFAEDGPFRYQMRSSGVTQESGDRADVFLSQLPMSHKKADHWHCNWDAAGPILKVGIESPLLGGRRLTVCLISRSPQNAAASRQRWGSPASERAQVNGNREAQVRTSGKNCCSRPRRARVALMNRRHLSRRILVWAVQRGHRMSSSGMTAAYVRVSNVCPRSTRICAVVAAHKSGRQLLGRPFMWAGLTLVRSQESRALRGERSSKLPAC